MFTFEGNRKHSDYASSAICNAVPGIHGAPLPSIWKKSTVCKDTLSWKRFLQQKSLRHWWSYMYWQLEFKEKPVFGLSEEMHVQSALLREKATATAIANVWMRYWHESNGLDSKNKVDYFSKRFILSEHDGFGLNMLFIQTDVLGIRFVQGIKLPWFRLFLSYCWTNFTFQSITNIRFRINESRSVGHARWMNS